MINDLFLLNQKTNDEGYFDWHQQENFYQTLLYTKYFWHLKK